MKISDFGCAFQHPLSKWAVSYTHLDVYKRQVTIHSTQSKYFVASRKFELPELKLLIDAVESSKFITKKKSETLIEKIHTMTSPGQVAKLKRNNYVVNRIKPVSYTHLDVYKRQLQANTLEIFMMKFRVWIVTNLI